MDTNCPKCKSEQTQSFAMANKAGTSSGIVGGVGMSGDGDVGFGGGISRQRTEIAKLTEPPKSDDGAANSIVLVILLVIAFNFIAIGLSFIVSWFVALPVAAVIAVAIGIFGMQWTKKQKPKRDAAHKAAMMKWEHRWLCHKCGNAFYVR